MMNKKDEKEEKLEKLEGGFNCYVNGAHKTSARYTPRHTTAKSSSTSDKKSFVKTRITPRSNIFDNIRELEQMSNKDRCQSAPSNNPGRKKWSNDSFTIKTNDGYEIKINAPNATRPQFSKSDSTCTKITPHKKNKKGELKYSDDFESESDLEETLKKETVRKEAQESDADNKDKQNSRNLIQSVKFSDVSDDSDIEEKKGPVVSKSKSNQNQENKLELKLSSNMINLLRQSINKLNFSSVNGNLVRFFIDFFSENR
jgi:hypothetical protein